MTVILTAPSVSRKSFVRRILPYLLVFLATLLILEILLRFLMGSGKVLSVELDLPDGRCLGLSPGVAVEYNGGPFDLKIPAVRHESNPYGYRGPARPHRKGSDVFRILMVGDSHTYGFGIEAEDAVAAQLEKFLNARSEQTIQVLNFGIPGMNLDEIVHQYGSFASRWEHDLVILNLVANDLGMGICEFTRANGWWFWLMNKVYVSRIIGRFFFMEWPHEENLGLTAQTLSKRLYQGIHQIRKLAVDAGTGLAVVCLTNPLPSEEALAGVLSDLNLPWFSLTGIEPENRLYDNHYSPRGARQVASLIADWLILKGISPGNVVPNQDP